VVGSMLRMLWMVMTESDLAEGSPFFSFYNDTSFSSNYTIDPFGTPKA
jgi:hypothetical protein